MSFENAEPEPMRKWVSDHDLRTDDEVLAEALDFIRSHGVRSVVMSDRIMDCPHEEGIDYPECPGPPKRTR